MTKSCNHKRHRSMLGAASAIALMIGGASAAAEEADKKIFNIEAQPLSEALLEFSKQSDVNVIAPSSLTRGHRATPVLGEYTPEEALKTMLGDADLEMRTQGNGSIILADFRAEEERGGRFRVAQVTQEDAVRDVGRQDADDEQQEDVIVVTGTNIRGVQPAGSPISVYSREDIEFTGHSTIQDFIQTLPENFGGGVAEDTQGGVVPGGGGINFGAGVNLRGLGNDSTLVLFNGRRLAPVGSGNSVDISMIPLAAVEAVEVLTDGASAIYGSDAVGGVVNFKLRSDYDGAETRLRLGSATSGDLDSIQVGQNFGKAWDSGNALVSYEYNRRDSLDANDRMFAEDASDPTDLLPNQERHSLFFSGRQSAGRSIEFFSDAFFSTREANALATGGSGAAIIAGSETDQFGASLGSTLAVGDEWQAEVVGAFSRSDVKTGTTNVATGEFSQSLGSEFTTWTIDGKIDGPTFSLPGGPVRVALGGNYRREEILFLDPLIMQETEDDRSVFAGFAEVNVPVFSDTNKINGVNRLNFTAAVRYEDYSDFGSTVDPKFGVAWSPIEGLNLRGTYGTSFRAPLLRELDTSSAIGFLFFLPDPLSMTGTTLSVIGRGGNPDLESETATTWTAGVDFEPAFVPGLRLETTYFEIDFDGRIQPTFAVFSALTDPLFSPLIDRSPSADLLEFFADAPFALNFAPGFEFTDAEVFVDERNRNVANVLTRGLDFDASYEYETDYGQIGINVNGTYLFEQSERLLPGTEAIDVVDTVFNPPNFRFRSSISWRNDSVGANLSMNYVDGYENNLVDPIVPIDAWTTADLYLSYSFGEIGNILLDDTMLSVSVLNLFDEDPPLVTPNFNSVNFDATNANSRGRTVAVQLIKQW